jgi:hypothetical protein
MKCLSITPPAIIFFLFGSTAAPVRIVILEDDKLPYNTKVRGNLQRPIIPVYNFRLVVFGLVESQHGCWTREGAVENAIADQASSKVRDIGEDLGSVSEICLA